MFRSLLFVAFAAGLAAFSITSSSRSARTPPDPAPGEGTCAIESSDPAHVARADGRFAAWLTVHESNQVAVAELALLRSAHPDVQRLARRLAEHHRASLELLRPFLGEVASARSANTRTFGFGRSETFEPSGADFEHVALVATLGEEALRSLLGEFDSASGPAFDLRYLAMVVESDSLQNQMCLVFGRRAASPLEAMWTARRLGGVALVEEARAVAAVLEQVPDPTPRVDREVGLRLSGALGALERP